MPPIPSYLLDPRPIVLIGTLIWTLALLGNMLFFLVPTKFPYLIANLDAARILGENFALTAGIFLGAMGCASSLVGLVYGRVAWRLHRYTLLTLTFVFFGTGLCGLGFATSLLTVGVSVVLVGLAQGILMPTILSWIAAITPKQFLGRASGGFSVAMNLGLFVSTLAIVPVIAVVATYGNLFLAFGSAAFALALPYALAMVKRQFAPPEVAVDVRPGAE